MKIGFLITARLKSKRLKFKILKPLNGFSVIDRVIQRAKQIKNCSDIVLCTSRLNQDLPLLRSAVNNGIYYYNGSADDVLKRLLDATELFKMDYFIGITADNPLFSIHHANIISDMFKSNSDLDFIYTSGMPIGLNIYGVSKKALKTVCEIKQENDTEIWGYLINRPEIFNVKEIKVTKKYKFNKSRMTLDEIDDYKFFEKLYNFFPKDSVIDILDAYKFLKNNPKITAINNKVKQKDLDNKIKKKISKFYKDNKIKILKIKKSIYL
tara:strand:- start:1675 stop:2475 length:801 start_codon:yes stop_codon:yes gene_type:complete